jgi:hypothetical protein
MRHIIVITVTLSCFASLAAAQPLYPVQQERYVSASTSSVDPNDPYGPLERIEQFSAAPGFDLWQADACVEAYEAQRWGNAGQYSTFSPAAMDAFGAVDVGLTTSLYDYYEPFVSDAASVYRLRFAVPDSVTFDRVGYASVEINVDGFSFVWWMDATTSVELRQIARPSVYSDQATLTMNNYNWNAHQIVDVPVAVAGELTPGVYELLVRATVHGEAQYDPQFTPPIVGEAGYVISAEFAPVPPEQPDEGDLDGDGDVDLVDFGRFQQAFSGPLVNQP